MCDVAFDDPNILKSHMQNYITEQLLNCQAHNPGFSKLGNQTIIQWKPTQVNEYLNVKCVMQNSVKRIV